jgi:hypothetical protein
MISFARASVQYLVRPVGSVQRLRRPYILGTFRGAEGKQKVGGESPISPKICSHVEKKHLYTRNISPNREPFDSSTHHHVDFRIGTTNSLEPPSILHRLEPEVPIKAAKTEVQDGSPQALSLDKEEAFNSRLSKIWQEMMTLESIPEWEYIISRWSEPNTL